MRKNYLLWGVVATGLIVTQADAAQVASGNHHTYVLTDQSTLLSFGENSECSVNRPDSEIREANLGRPSDELLLDPSLGDFPCNRAQFNPVPGEVQGLAGLIVVKVISGQNDGAVITDLGDLYTWGRNDRGQSGTGNTEPIKVAARVDLSGQVVDVSIGNAHTLAVLSDGSVYSWGFYANGVLGLGQAVTDARESILVPQQVDLPAGEKAIRVLAESARSSVILTESGKVYMMGTNSQGQMGQGSKDIRTYHEPTLVQGLDGVNIVNVFIGSSNIFALSDQGDLYGWGDASKGHFSLLEDDGSINSNDLLLATKLDHITDALDGSIIDFDAGARHALAVTDKGTTYAWGFHTYTTGNLGIGPIIDDDNAVGPYYPVPIVIPELMDKTVIDVNVLTNNSYAVTDEGEVYGWGQTANGRLAMGIKSCDRTVSQTGRYSYACLTPQLLVLSTDIADINLKDTADFLGLSFAEPEYAGDEGDILTLAYSVKSPAAVDLILPLTVNEISATVDDVRLFETQINLPARTQSGEIQIELLNDELAEVRETLEVLVDAENAVLVEGDPTKLNEEQNSAVVAINFDQQDGGLTQVSTTYLDADGEPKNLSAKILGLNHCEFSEFAVNSESENRHPDSVMGALEAQLVNCDYYSAPLIKLQPQADIDFNGVRSTLYHGACSLERPFIYYRNNFYFSSRDGGRYDLDQTVDGEIRFDLDVISNQFNSELLTGPCRHIESYNVKVNRVLDVKQDYPHWSARRISRYLSRNGYYISSYAVSRILRFHRIY